MKNSCNLKRTLYLCLVMFLVLSLSACGGKSDGEISSDANVGDNKSNIENVERAVFGLNDTAVFDNMTVTAVEVKETSGDEFFKPDDGNIFVGMKFSIKNTEKQTETISSLLQFSATVDNAEADYSLSAITVFEDTVDGDIEAGKTIEGWYAVEVPRDWGKIEIYYQNDILSDKKVKFLYKKPKT